MGDNLYLYGDSAYYANTFGVILRRDASRDQYDPARGDFFTVAEKCPEILKSAGFEVDYQTDFSKEELLNFIADYDGLVVRSSTQVDADLIEKMGSIEIIAEQVRELSLSNINIASLSLGRKSEGDYALTIVNIDSPLNEEVRNSISSIDGIKDIYAVCI